MDNQKPLLFAALTFILFLIWQAWQKDYNTPVPVAQTNPAAEVAGQLPADVPSPTLTNPEAAEAVKSSTAPANTAQGVRVVTDVYEINIDPRGAGVRQMNLLQYPIDKKKPDETVHLMDFQGPKFFISQSGFLGTEGKVPNHLSEWTPLATEYRLGEGEDTLEVPFTWTNGEGVKVTKTITFRRGSYKITETYLIENQGGEALAARPYAQLQRNPYTGDKENSFIYTYTGAVLYTDEESYEKIDFDDIADQDLKREATGGWSAMLQHYFVAAWIPPTDASYHFYTKQPDLNRYVIGAYRTQQTVVNPGQSAAFTQTLFAGPKLQDQMAEVAPGLELTVDYGKLTILAEPVFWLLDLFHDWVGNWGFAIIMVTVLIKLVFYGLSEKSYRSMAHMRRVQPRIVAMKERYGDDKQKLNEAMMDLYKKEKINPLGGCLPILVQIPVFISLYWVLLESVEMRQAPFILWMDNLSEADPYFILPLLMGVSMYIQQKLNPAPVDPMQQKIMNMLPIIFTLFFAYFPSGLVLYWVVNNVLSIAQQWVITKRIESGAET